MPEIACRLLMGVPAPNQGWQIGICMKCCEPDSSTASRPEDWQSGF